MLDDASDPSAAVVNIRRLTLEEKLDAIISSTTTPSSLALIDAVAESGTPTISLASSATIIEPMIPKKAWVFKTPQTDTMMGAGDRRARRGLRCHDLGLHRLQRCARRGVRCRIEKFALLRKIRIVTNERVSHRAIPAVLPAHASAERGCKGRLYFNHGVANNDFLRVGGKDLEGAFLPTSPVLVAAALPAGHPARRRRSTTQGATKPHTALGASQRSGTTPGTMAGCSPRGAGRAVSGRAGFARVSRPPRALNRVRAVAKIQKGPLMLD